MSKIYRVKVTYDVLVVADDEPNATLVARDEIRDIVGDQDPDELACFGQITKRAEIPTPWIGCLPYGGDCDSRVEDYLPS